MNIDSLGKYVPISKQLNYNQPLNLSICRLRMVHLSCLFTDFSVLLLSVLHGENEIDCLFCGSLLSHICTSFWKQGSGLPEEETTALSIDELGAFCIIVALVYGALFPCSRHFVNVVSNANSWVNYFHLHLRN